MEAAVHKRNLESSILFMQQEHATTLKALHDEIHKLQNKCTDLTFQLTMNGISVEDEGEVDMRLHQAHQQLQESQDLESALETQLSKGSEQMHTLERELRLEKKRHLDEMRQASQTISSLKAEVEAKANNIAFLTTELHRLKVKQRAGEGRGGADMTGPTIVRRTQPQYGTSHLPAPPREMLTNSARLRHRGHHPLTSTRRMGPAPTPTITATGVVSEAEAEALARSLRVTSASTRSSGSESPDISPFVHRDVGEVPVVEVVKKPVPLPPIASAHPGLGERDPPLNKADLQQMVVTATKRGPPRGALSRPHPHPSTPEVTTLAIDQVSDTNWKRPSQSHSQDSN